MNPIYIPTTTADLFTLFLATVIHRIEQLEPAEDTGQFSWEEAQHKSTGQLETVLQLLSTGHKNISLSSPGLLPANKITESNVNHIGFTVSLPWKGDP